MKMFNEYFQRGFLKKQPANFDQISRQIRRAKKDMVLARSLLDDDSEWAATIAYQAMLRSGRALLFSYNYLPADGQQHKTVVELTGLIIGDEFKDLTNQFNKLRKKRNIFFYESDTGCNLTEAKRFIAVAQKLISVIEIEIKKLSPQTELKL